MKRRIIRIDEEKCNGCGACAAACHEGAIEMIDGKAKLTREDYCDGLGDCLPQCPTDAISFEEREAPAYDEAAVLAARRQKQAAHSDCPGTQARMLHREDMPTQNSAHGCPGSQVRAIQRKEVSAGSTASSDAPTCGTDSSAPNAAHGCPGSQVRTIQREEVSAGSAASSDTQLHEADFPVRNAAHGCPGSQARTLRRENMPAQPAAHGCPGSRMRTLTRSETPAQSDAPAASELRQWPCQIRLAPVRAPYFDGAKLLIAADCTAYAYARFHSDFMRGKVTLIGCPKLDGVDYAEKLTEILRANDIQSVTVLRMEVPCCGGLENAAKRALQACGKFLPWHVVTLSIDGRILD